jgi:hypothetical protein
MNRVGVLATKADCHLTVALVIGIIIADKNRLAGLFVMRTVVAPELGLLGSVGLEAKASDISPQQCGDFFMVIKFPGDWAAFPQSGAECAGGICFGGRAALWGRIPVRQFDNPVGKEETNGPQHQRRDTKREIRKRRRQVGIAAFIRGQDVFKDIFKARPHVPQAIEDDQKTNRPDNHAK